MEKPSLDKSGLIGAAGMISLAAVAGWRWYQTGYVFFALVLFRDLVGALFLLIRRTAEERGPAAASLLAYLSSVLPLTYLSTTDVMPRITLLGSSLLSITGYLLATLALIELGTAFGVTPARRGARRCAGVYRYISHPMYVGYVVAEAGLVLLNPLNMPIFLLSASAYYLRARQEERVFHS